MSEEQSSESTEPLLPEFGDDKTPSAEMVVQGKVGNGSYTQLTSKLASQIQSERAVMKREMKRARVEAYEEGVKDTLESVATLESGILEIGLELMKRLERGEALNRQQLDTLKLAQQTAKEMKDRVIPKKSVSEVNHNTSILALIAGYEQ